MGRRNRAGIFAVCMVWVCAIGAGFGILEREASTPGVAAKPPRQWPAADRVALTPGQATLILFAHPHCPCTRASLGELARLLVHCQHQLTAYVLFVRPQGVSEDWTHTDLWRSAAAIPGVHVLCDEKGEEARRFQAATSGQTLLYGPQGRLLFSGGITAARGHWGDNAGSQAILTLLAHPGGGPVRTPVFGCSLR